MRLSMKHVKSVTRILQRKPDSFCRLTVVPQKAHRTCGEARQAWLWRRSPKIWPATGVAQKRHAKQPQHAFAGSDSVADDGCAVVVLEP